MNLKPCKILLTCLVVTMTNIAVAALVGLDYPQSTPSAEQNNQSQVPPLPSAGGTSVGGNKSGTPSQEGNVNAVSALLHPVPKESAANTAANRTPEPMTLEDTRGLVMDNSINAYPGPCACPYSRNSDGYECGIEAAYYKPGGFRIYCYPEDVRGQLNIFYRKTH